MGPHFIMPEFSAQVAAELDEFCRTILERAQIVGNCLDVLLLAQRLGMEVVIDQDGPHRARCLRLYQGSQARWVLLLHRDVRPERLQWAAAHELGEALAAEAAARLGWDIDDIQPAGREWLANEIAKRFLLPFPQFVVDGNEVGWDLIRLKERYPNVSHEVIARRMLDAPPPVIITIIDNGTLYWRRSNGPLVSPPMTPGEKACWTATHHGGQSARHEDPRESIACWAIHETGWRREIMRTEVFWIDW